MIGKSDSESVIHERKKQLDKISLRELLTELYHGLNVTVVNKNDSIISTQIPPRMFFNWNFLKAMHHKLFYTKYQNLLQRSNQFIYYLKSLKVFSYKIDSGKIKGC